MNFRNCVLNVSILKILKNKRIVRLSQINDKRLYIMRERQYIAKEKKKDETSNNVHLNY